MKRKEIPITGIRMPKSTKDGLRKVSIQEGRTMNWLMLNALYQQYNIPKPDIEELIEE